MKVIMVFIKYSMANPDHMELMELELIFIEKREIGNEAIISL